MESRGDDELKLGEIFRDFMTERHENASKCLKQDFYTAISDYHTVDGIMKTEN